MGSRKISNEDLQLIRTVGVGMLNVFKQVSHVFEHACLEVAGNGLVPGGTFGRLEVVAEESAVLLLHITHKVRLDVFDLADLDEARQSTD